MKTTITIGGRRIGPGEPVYIVAEMAANHGQRLEEAMRLLGAAKRAGADAIKLRGEMPAEWLPQMAELAGDLELGLFSNPEDDTRKLFGDFEAPAYEIAATELDLVQRFAATGKPLLLAAEESASGVHLKAISAAQKAGGKELALLWRGAAIPTPADQLRLRAIPRLHESCGLPVGFGDHTLGTAAAVAAVALGAAIIEKHLTLSRTLPVAESSISLEPDELARMVAEVRTAEEALGDDDDSGS